VGRLLRGFIVAIIFIHLCLQCQNTFMEPTESNGVWLPNSLLLNLPSSPPTYLGRHKLTVVTLHLFFSTPRRSDSTSYLSPHLILNPYRCHVGAKQRTFAQSAAYPAMCLGFADCKLRPVLDANHRQKLPREQSLASTAFKLDIILTSVHHNKHTRNQKSRTQCLAKGAPCH